MDTVNCTKIPKEKILVNKHKNDLYLENLKLGGRVEDLQWERDHYKYLISKILEECKIINVSMDILKTQDASKEKSILALANIESAVENIEYFANNKEIDNEKD